MPAAPSSESNQFSGMPPLSSSSTPVLMTQNSEHTWLAQLLAWPGLIAEGSSREEALRKLDQQVQAQLAQGEIAYLALPPMQAQNPWLEIAGKYANDPNWEDYLAAIANARQETNVAEGIWLDRESLA
jgi:predicted RNase H-like HicB family nuclease